VDLLLERKADLAGNTKRGWSPLIFAATRNYPRIVEKLIRAGAGVDHRDKSMNTALIYAVLSGSNHSVKILLEGGASIDDKLFSPVKYSPLQLAAALKNFQAVQYLVEAGADINFTGLSIKNAFVFAVENGDYQTVKYLVEKGCDINTNGLTGPSPLKIAKTKGYTAIAQLLMEHKASE
jgi:ankyrin repeat protein